MRVALVLVLVAACSFAPGASATGDAAGSGSDARGSGSDGGTLADALETGACVGTFVKVCATTAPTDDLMITQNTSIDTDHYTGCLVLSQGPSAPPLCVIYKHNISVGARLIAYGSRPLVLAAFDSITIAGVVDVSSKLVKSQVGAAANDPSCTAPGTPGGGGGGAGGSFGAQGGPGGGDGIGTSGSDPANAIQPPIAHVHGGCGGGQGGGTGGGRGGASGGAVLLIATNMIGGTGSIVAGGGGGLGGAPTTGGGGGGAGGFIGFEATGVKVTGYIVANGGGGGEGGDALAGGANGGDANENDQAGRGGNTTTNLIAGPGGDGSSGGSGASGSGGSLAAASGGGGAGGGGAGLIVMFNNTSVMGSGTYSPSFQTQ